MKEFDHTVYVHDSDDSDESALLTVSAPDAEAWAKHRQSVLGSSWESDGPHFAYAVVSVYPGFLKDLEGEEYTVNDDNYLGDVR